MRWDVFNGRATQRAFADGLGLNTKADPETIGFAILVLRQVASPSLCQDTPTGIIDKELGEHCTHDWFYMHQVLLACMMIFSQWRASNPGTSVSSPKLYRLGYHGAWSTGSRCKKNTFYLVDSQHWAFSMGLSPGISVSRRRDCTNGFCCSSACCLYFGRYNTTLQWCVQHIHSTARSTLPRYARRILWASIFINICKYCCWCVK